MALTSYDGGGGGLSGDQVLDEVFDLISRRLPRLRPDDPVREILGACLPGVARDLGRPIVQLVHVVEEEH